MTSIDVRSDGYHIEGRRYPRVTSILNVLAKPGLDAWRRKVGAEEADRVMRAGSELGTRVHQACWPIALGESTEAIVSSVRALHQFDLVPYVEAFGRWMSERVADVLGAERVLWSERYAYAGTTDLLVRLRDGRRAVVDLKTSRSLSETYRLQLAAYALALDEAGEPYDSRIALWLPSTDPGVVVEREYADHETDRRAWLAALALHAWQTRCRDDWKQDRELVDGARVTVAAP